MLRIATAIFAFLTPLLPAQEAEEWLTYFNDGTQAYETAHYRKAVDGFRKAAELNPANIAIHLGLARSYIGLYNPAADSAENTENARRAEQEFLRAIEISPNDAGAISALASFLYDESQELKDAGEKGAKLAQARGWYQRLLEGDESNERAWYMLGVIAWAESYPDIAAARSQSGTGGPTAGAISSAAVRNDLRNRRGGLIDAGMSNLRKALEINPDYADAMTFLALFLRERAELRDAPEPYREDIAAAEEWDRKANEAAGREPAAAAYAEGGVQPATLVRKVDPVYPPFARDARIEGVVRFSAVVGADGHVVRLQRISGHPLLAQAARDAVRQWVYQPPVVNGQPSNIVTQVVVSFSLNEGVP